MELYWPKVARGFNVINQTEAGKREIRIRTNILSPIITGAKYWQRA